MSWQDCRKERAASAYFKLPNDGDKATIVIVGEPSPVKRPGMKGGIVTRYTLPVVDKTGLKTWDMSGKTLDAVAALPNGGLGERYVVTRVGAAGSADTYYTFTSKPLSDDERKRLAESGLLERGAVHTPPPATPPVANRDSGEDAIPF